MSTIEEQQEFVKWLKSNDLYNGIYSQMDVSVVMVKMQQVWAKMKAERQWQTMETAPKDGSEVLVLLKGGQRHFVRWNKPYEHWRSDSWGELNPTDWLPLPPLPEEE